jgi:hypothetical protein
MDVAIGTEDAQFPEKEYKNWIFLAVPAKLDLPGSNTIGLASLGPYVYKF